MISSRPDVIYFIRSGKNELTKSNRVEARSHTYLFYISKEPLTSRCTGRRVVEPRMEIGQNGEISLEVRNGEGVDDGVDGWLMGRFANFDNVISVITVTN